jgi:hypothetical protein
MLGCAGGGTHLRVEESVMHKRAMTASTAALSALFLAALPASADTEYTGIAPSIDWRLVVILTVFALSAFYAVQELMNRGR